MKVRKVVIPVGEIGTRFLRKSKIRPTKMGRKFLITIAVLSILLLTACNLTGEDPGEENEETVGTGEQDQNPSSKDEESENDDMEEPSESSEDEDAEEDNNIDEEGEDSEDGEEDEDSEDAEVTLKLQVFYGTWEMEDEDNTSDVMILEISDAKAEVAKDQEEDFEYIRFGYKYSEFFPMEKIIEIEELDSDNSYKITTVYIEEVGEDAHGMYQDLSEEETQYTMELSEENTLLLSHDNGEEVVEMEFKR